MTRTRQHVIFAAPLALLMSCSLAVDVELPEQGSDSDCAPFDRTKPDGVNDCVKWQFNPGSLQCELVPLDRDNDGFYPAVCIGDPVANIEAGEEDCSDDASTGGKTYPGAIELCDGLDNDCDSRIDEGVLVPRPSDGPTINFSSTINDISYAVDSLAANTVAVAFTLPDGTPGTLVRDRNLGNEPAARFRVYTTDAADSDAAEAGANAVRSDGVDIAPLGNNQYAVAFVNPSTPRRVIAGVVSKDRSTQLFVETSVFASGLPCAPSDGDCSALRPLADKPRIAVSGSDALVITTRRELPVNECATGVGEVAVVGNALKKRDFARVTLPSSGGVIPFPALRPTAENPAGLDLGMVREDASPAAIGVPDVGFVVALPQLDGTLLLRTVTVTSNVYALAPASRDVTVESDDDDQPLLEPAFALSPAFDHDGNSETANTRLLALAYRAGCGGRGLVKTKLFTIDSNGALRAFRNVIAIDGEGLVTSTSETRPTITFSAEHQNTWLVTYAKRQDLRARVLSSNGTLHGAESYVLLDGATRLGQTPAAFSLPQGALGTGSYGAMIDATIDGENGIHTIHLGCFDSRD